MRTLLATLLLVLALPVEAVDAARLPTRSERREILSLANFPAHCLSIRVSTVRTRKNGKPTRWAAAFLHGSEQCLGNGIGYFVRVGGVWNARGSGPWAREAPCRWLSGPVPLAAARDLRLCR